MPEKETLRRARRDKRQGKAPTTQAGEFVREEIHHVREGKHGARSTEQAIAIGLAKARRAGVKLPAPPKRVRQSGKRKTSPVSRKALSRHATRVAKSRPASARRASARKAARTRKRTASSSRSR
jgi:hypothetical protein